MEQLTDVLNQLLRVNFVEIYRTSTNVFIREARPTDIARHGPRSSSGHAPTCTC